MSEIPSLTYDDWRRRSLRDPHADTVAAAPAPDAPRAAIPAGFLARLVLEQAAGTVQVVGGLRCVNLDIVGDVQLENFTIPFPLHFSACRFTGYVRIREAKTRTLDFEGSDFERGADFRNSVVDGHLILRRGFRSEGPVIARDMRIAGTVDCTGALFLYDGMSENALSKDAAGDGFGFSRSTAVTLYWRDLAAPPRGRVTLRDAHVRAFVHDLDRRPVTDLWPAKGSLNLDGFSYERIDQCDPRTAIAWLDLQTPFSASSYSALARGFETLNLRQDAEIIWARLKLREVQQLKPAVWRWMNHVLFWIIGYGRSPANALIFMLALFAAHFAVVDFTYGHAYWRPLTNELLMEQCFYGGGAECKARTAGWKAVTVDADGRKEARFVPRDYPAFSAIEYSLQSFVPLLAFGQDKYWEPTPGWLRILLPSLAALGLFLGGLFAGSVAGLLSPKERRA